MHFSFGKAKGRTCAQPTRDKIKDGGYIMSDNLKTMRILKLANGNRKIVADDGEWPIPHSSLSTIRDVLATISEDDKQEIVETKFTLDGLITLKISRFHEKRLRNKYEPDFGKHNHLMRLQPLYDGRWLMVHDASGDAFKLSHNQRVRLGVLGDEWIRANASTSVDEITFHSAATPAYLMSRIVTGVTTYRHPLRLIVDDGDQTFSIADDSANEEWCITQPALDNLQHYFCVVRERENVQYIQSRLTLTQLREEWEIMRIRRVPDAETRMQMTVALLSPPACGCNGLKLLHEGHAPECAFRRWKEREEQE